jgi:hypothetical protein
MVRSLVVSMARWLAELLKTGVGGGGRTQRAQKLRKGRKKEILKEIQKNEQ